MNTTKISYCCDSLPLPIFVGQVLHLLNCVTISILSAKNNDSEWLSMESGICAEPIYSKYDVIISDYIEALRCISTNITLSAIISDTHMIDDMERLFDLCTENEVACTDLVLKYGKHDIIDAIYSHEPRCAIRPLFSISFICAGVFSNPEHIMKCYLASGMHTQICNLLYEHSIKHELHMHGI